MAVEVKICCISSHAEADLAIDAGADVLGLVSAMPSGPGAIAEDDIADIASSVAGSCSTFLLTALTEASGIVRQARRLGTTAVQLVDRVDSDVYPRIRDSLPELRIVQVVHVLGEESLQEADALAPLVDVLLLDSGNPSLSVKELGGTGRRHDWGISQRIVATVDVPVFLAGGLNPENVATGVATVGPYGVDVCSGVRHQGRLDPERVGRFIVAAKGAGGSDR